MLHAIKKAYWKYLTARNRKRVSLSLSPHDPLDAIVRQVGRTEHPVMIDGGAHDGKMSLKFREVFPDLEVHSFEPNGDLFPRLEANLAAVPGSRNQLALAARSQILRFIVNDSPMTSSVLERGRPSEQYFDAATRPQEVREVRASSLDDWCDANAVNRIDILKLDLQGYELEALRGATRVLRRGVRCVYAEVNFIPFYEGSALFSELDGFLRPLGYRLHNLYNLCTHLPEGQIGSGDALWVFEGDPVVAQSMRAA